MPRKTDSRFAQLADQSRIADQSGPGYWRSLEELSRSEEFLDALQHEFPDAADTWIGDSGIGESGKENGTATPNGRSSESRREFLKLMGASLALAGVSLSGCFKQPKEDIVPYVDPPETVVPGIPLYFATAYSLRGRASRLLVESHMGRPTKIEGSPTLLKDGSPVEPVDRSPRQPNDPIRFGPSDVFSQATILTMYDPDRSQTPLFRGQVRPWRTFTQELQNQMQLRGEKFRLRILTETVTSPTTGHLLSQILEKFPEARWHQWEPINHDFETAGLKAAFGDLGDDGAAVPEHDFAAASVILSLDDDFLLSCPETLPIIGGFSEARVSALKNPTKKGMARFYMVEGAASSTGAKADHRLPLRPSRIPAFAASLAAELGVEGAEAIETDWSEEEAKFLAALVSDLKENTGETLVTCGLTQPAPVHTLVAAINAHLESVGEDKPVRYRRSPEVRPVVQSESLAELVDAMNDGDVEMLLILGGNPVYNAPAELKFGEALKKVDLRAHINEFDDETSILCQWHLCLSHTLESWGDVRSADGTVSPVQPLIDPLYESKSIIEVLSTLAGRFAESPVDVIKSYWGEQFGVSGKKLDDLWANALHDGYVADTATEILSATPSADMGEVMADLRKINGRERSRVELTFRPDPTIWDGRYANNGWLQETPKPLTKLTWDNAGMLSPATAAELGVKTGDTIEIDAGTGETLRVAVFLVPGHAEGTVSLTLGYGRERAGSVADGLGFNAYKLRTIGTSWVAPNVTINRVDAEPYILATTQNHFLMEGRDLVRTGTFDELKAHPDHPEFMHSHHGPRDASFYTLDEHSLVEEGGYKWGMLIDQTACVGCNACVVACQSENNIPVVGKDQVHRGREMHWIRIDTYFSGETGNPETYFQPVLCMHCELAPCEVVCPVGATTHSPEGLNEMTYNRCIGTRYCSNNCPYKVRRFNFFDYTQYGDLPVLEMLQNPDVTVRNRGVMEKCTYCVQRINKAKINAKVEDRTIVDGDLQTACQAACPANAITFGNLNDEESEVAAEHDGPLTYALLEELNTRPRTRYTAVVSHPHPDLHEGHDGDDHKGDH